MIALSDKKDCCGCNACGDICPQGAISFEADSEGFLYPKVDDEKCIRCGLCLKTCPQIHAAELKRNEFSAPKCFAAVHKNLTVRFDSTSGGIFSALANVVYRQGGYVGGAIWNEDFSIRQYVSDKKSDLPRLRSSKYAQSDAQGFYRAVKDAVASGKLVLVCGTPCQMFALKAFLGREYENLILVDFICRGNNSPLVFRKYLDWQESRVGGKVVYIKPKNKELGWRKLTTKLVFDNGTVIYDTKDTSYFTKGYLATNAYCRPSCYSCKFKGIPRVSEFTLADFWGADALGLSQELDDNIGTSLVLVNNSKGVTFFTEAQKSLRVQELTWHQALRGNGMLQDSIPQPKCDRQAFFKVLNEQGFGECARQFVGQPRYTLKTRIHDILRRAKRLLLIYRLSPVGWYRYIRLNGLFGMFSKAGTFVPRGRVLVESDGKISLGGDFDIGNSYYRKALRNTAIAVRKGGALKTSGFYTLMEGADIEVFSGGTLELGAGGGFNIGATIVCGERITIGADVQAGRHVTIRDTNGGHCLNMPGFRNTKPVEIGDHVWLCEGCTIMPGVKIGAGAVVGAKAVVFNSVPPNTLVMGNPAEVVCEQIEWKY